jgi:hypothetical protein
MWFNLHVFEDFPAIFLLVILVSFHWDLLWCGVPLQNSSWNLKPKVIVLRCGPARRLRPRELIGFETGLEVVELMVSLSLFCSSSFCHVRTHVPCGGHSNKVPSWKQRSVLTRHWARWCLGHWLSSHHSLLQHHPSLWLCSWLGVVALSHCPESSQHGSTHC